MGLNALPGHPYLGMVFLTHVANSTTTPPMLVGRSMSDWKRTFSAALDVFLLVSLGAGLALVSAWLIDVVLLTDIADYLTSSSGGGLGARHCGLPCSRPGHHGGTARQIRAPVAAAQGADLGPL
jgi:hypothetical protein